jgi:hypothetical protein
VIGTNDFTLYPLVLPGSIVQIARDHKIRQHDRWRSEIERPIYFFEMRDGYTYGWCEIEERYFERVVPSPVTKWFKAIRISS